MQCAFACGSREEHDIYTSEVEDVAFSLWLEEPVYAGDSFDVEVDVKNKSEAEKREIKVNFTAVLSYYTGARAKKLKSNKDVFVVNPQAGNFAAVNIADA